MLARMKENFSCFPYFDAIIGLLLDHSFHELNYKKKLAFLSHYIFKKKLTSNIQYLFLSFVQ
jgi:hypothetical protein